MKPVRFQRRAIQLSVLGSFYKNPRYSLNMSVLMWLTKIEWHAMCLDGPSSRLHAMCIFVHYLTRKTLHPNFGTVWIQCQGVSVSAS